MVCDIVWQLRKRCMHDKKCKEIDVIHAITVAVEVVAVVVASFITCV
jgi:hypothetical protein